MRLVLFAVCVFAVSLLAACEPTFNWRETPIAPTSLVAMFPCKPKKEARRVAFGGMDVQLHMTSCDTAGVTVAVANASLANPGMAGPMLAQWRDATLAGMRASTSTVSALQLERADLFPQSVNVQAIGVRPDGQAVRFQGAWFARGTEVFAALMYYDKLDPEVVDTFFSGIKFR